MADLSKIKSAKPKENRFGAPLQPTETSEVLMQPEHAPASPEASVITRKARGKTGRTIPFSTKVSEKFDKEFRRIAFDDGVKHAELMELSLAAYQKQKR